MKKILSLVIATFCLAPACFVQAEELNYNLYSLQASASADVVNDLMVVTMVATNQSSLAKDASAAVNTDMAWALEQVGSGVDTRTEGYSTSPQYRSDKIQSWIVTQNLRLESDDFELLTDLVTELQSRLQVRSMTFGVKTETRLESENQLIVEALASYRQRADIVAESIQATGFEMVNTNINTQNTYSPVYARQETMRMSSMADSAVAVEAGESKITVTVNGQIQLEF